MNKTKRLLWTQLGREPTLADQERLVARSNVEEVVMARAARRTFFDYSLSR